MSEHDVCMVITTTPNREEARRLARGLVQERLAACVQMLDIESVYWWEDAIQQDPETLLLIKTLCSRFADVENYIRTHHPYEVPEILQIPTNAGATNYVEWLKEYVGSQKKQAREG